MLDSLPQALARHDSCVVPSPRTLLRVSTRYLLLLVAGLLCVPGGSRAQAQQTDSASTPMQNPDASGLRERTQNLLSPEMTASAPHPVHVVPFKLNATGAKPARARIGAGNPPACSSPQLSYFGGPVISHIQSVAVFWNGNVNSQIVANMPQFLGDVSNSTYMSVLSQYGTYGSKLGSTKTNQVIGHGNPSVQGITISPLKCPTTTSTKMCTITDTDIQNELQRQITAKVLPAQTYDSNGNAQTIYMVFFPPYVGINDPVIGTSCVSGGFCAYHNTGGTINQPLLYGAMMDEYSSACSTGCGSDATALENSTEVASHEFGEAITDAEIGLDTNFNYAYPAAWGDNSNGCGEIGDICDSGFAGDTITVSGRSWVVQQLWSNEDKQCESSGTSTAPFVLGISGSATAGNPLSFTVTAENPTGGTNTGYTGTVHFTSSDADAGLPNDYTFVGADSGQHTFSVTFQTGGTQSVTATDTSNADLTGTNSVTVAGQSRATLTSPAQNSVLAGPSVTFAWSAGSGATGYAFWLGSTAGAHDLYASGSITATSVTRTNLPTDGETIYARLYTIFGSTRVYTDYTFTAATTAGITSPKPGTTLPGASVTFTWSAGNGATDYALWLGTTVGAHDLYTSGPTTATSETRNNLPTNGATIYARLYTYFGSTRVYTDYTYTAAP